jgi:multiple sugar transport system substrate-binding protein
MGKKLNDRYNIFFTIIIVAITSLLILNLYTKDSAFSEGEVTKIYFADNISEAHKIVISMFNEKYSGKIEVVPINLPFTKFNTNERKELLARSLRSKDSRIDIFAVDLIWVPRFAKWAEPLDDYFTEEEISKILPYALSTCYYGKMLVGIPLYLDLGALYYRKDILKNWINYEQLEAKLKNSISWQEFIQIGIQNPDNRPFYIFQGAAYEGLICNFVEVLGGDGGNLINSGIIEVNNSMAIKSCQLMVDLIYKYNISPEFVSTFDENETYRYSLKHDVPFFRCWTSSLKDIHAYPGDSSKIKYLGIAPLPHFEGCNSASTFGGWNLMVSKNSLKKKDVKYQDMVSTF